MKNRMALLGIMIARAAAAAIVRWCDAQGGKMINYVVTTEYEDGITICLPVRDENSLKYVKSIFHEWDTSEDKVNRDLQMKPGKRIRSFKVTRTGKESSDEADG